MIRLNSLSAQAFLVGVISSVLTFSRFGTFMAVRCYKLGADWRLNGVQNQPLKWLPFWIVLGAY